MSKEVKTLKVEVFTGIEEAETLEVPSCSANPLALLNAAHKTDVNDGFASLTNKINELIAAWNSLVEQVRDNE